MRAMIYVAILAGLYFPISSSAEVRGIVVDAESLERLPSANVVCADAAVHVVSDRNGRFTIDGLAPGEYVVSISHVGYKTQTRTVLLAHASAVGEETVDERFAMTPLTLDAGRKVLVIAERDHASVVENALSLRLASTEDALQSVEGISMVRRGYTSFDPVLRGLKANRINVTIDGARIHGACPGRMDPPTTYLEVGELANMEIVKGPNSVAMGPNNLGGSLNLVAMRPRQRVSLAINASGEFGYSSAAAATKSKLELSGGTRPFAFRANATYQRSGNYRAGGNEELANTSFERMSLGGYADFYLRDDRTIEVTALGNIGRNVGYPALPMDAERDEGIIGSVRYSARDITDSWTMFSSRAYVSRVAHTMNNERRSTYRMMQMETVGGTRTFGGDLLAEFALSSQLLSAGTDAFVTRGDATRTSKMMGMPEMTSKLWPTATVGGVGVFFEWWRPLIHGATLKVGARGDRHSSKASNPQAGYSSYWGLTSEPSRSQYGYSGTASLTLPIAETASVSGSISRGNRAPGITEYYAHYLTNRLDNYDYIGNPGLKNESNLNLEARLTATSGRFRGEVAGYRNRITHYIVGRTMPELTTRTNGAAGVKVYDNLGSAEIWGVEGSYNIALPRRFRLLGNVAYVVGTEAGSNDPLPEMPPFDATVGLKYVAAAGKMWAQLDARFVAEQNRVSQSSGEDATDAFNVVDIRFGYTALRYVDIFGGVENVFDVRYHEHLNRNNIRSPGRNVYVSFAAAL